MIRETDKRWGFPVWITKFKVPVFLGIIEFCILLIADLSIARIILGHHIPKPPLPFSISPAVASYSVAFILCYINIRIIGRDSRIHRYKEIFDAWDKGKRLRWKILVISIMFASITAAFLVGEVTQNGLNPQSWKY